MLRPEPTEQLLVYDIPDQPPAPLPSPTRVAESMAESLERKRRERASIGKQQHRPVTAADQAMCDRILPCHICGASVFFTPGGRLDIRHDFASHHRRKARSAMLGREITDQHPGSGF
jgi:hypothetical protein